jgi:hypothetical protein
MASRRSYGVIAFPCLFVVGPRLVVVLRAFGICFILRTLEKASLRLVVGAGEAAHISPFPVVPK